MPIRPENKKLYPKNWRAIRDEILRRAKNSCEFCGVENHRWIHRIGSEYHYAVLCEGRCPSRITSVVLTIAHLNHNPKDSRRCNLRALCQRCHLNYDRDLHRINAARARIEKQIKRGQLFLPGGMESWTPSQPK